LSERAIRIQKSQLSHPYSSYRTQRRRCRLKSTLSDSEILRLRNVEKKTLAEIGTLCGGVSKVAVFKKLKKVNGVNLINPRAHEAAKTHTVPPQVNAKQREKFNAEGVNGTPPKYPRQTTARRIYELSKLCCMYIASYPKREDMESSDGLLSRRG